ncbi:hypothetical protein [Nocardia tengchongensis]|uniref:hypothetical protein n=1 Tax=Nocardia tengchongensis TaxID=2055889 RepID=UPI003681C922
MTVDTTGRREFDAERLWSYVPDACRLSYVPAAERAARVAAAGLQGVAEVAGCSLRATRRAGCTSRCRLIAASTISSRDTIRTPGAAANQHRGAVRAIASRSGHRRGAAGQLVGCGRRVRLCWA